MQTIVASAYTLQGLPLQGKYNAKFAMASKTQQNLTTVCPSSLSLAALVTSHTLYHRLLVLAETELLLPQGLCRAVPSAAALSAQRGPPTSRPLT